MFVNGSLDWRLETATMLDVYGNHSQFMTLKSFLFSLNGIFFGKPNVFTQKKTHEASLSFIIYDRGRTISQKQSPNYYKKTQTDRLYADQSHHICIPGYLIL